VPDEQLRYADGPSTEASILIDAPPSVVWALVTDISLPVRFSTELQGVEWLDGTTSPRLGARFIGRNRHDAAGEWETTSTVCDYEEDAVFGWAVGEPGHPSSRWRFTLAPEGAGTRLTQWMQMGPARSGINAAIDAMPDKESRILRRRLDEHRANMYATLEGIRGLAES
jgi:uncharacterized protein YndB with AHSA1/START domain